jgi:hypothetical protein
MEESNLIIFAWKLYLESHGEFLRIVEGLIWNPYENCEVFFLRLGDADILLF